MDAIGGTPRQPTSTPSVPRGQKTVDGRVDVGAQVRTRYLTSSLSRGLTDFHSSFPAQNMRYESSAYGPLPGTCEIAVGGYGTSRVPVPSTAGSVTVPRERWSWFSMGGSVRKVCEMSMKRVVRVSPSPRSLIIS